MKNSIPTIAAASIGIALSSASFSSHALGREQGEAATRFADLQSGSERQLVSAPQAQRAAQSEGVAVRAPEEPREPSAEGKTALDIELARATEVLRAAGFEVRSLRSDSPLLIDGAPALAFIVSDEHTKDGQAFSRSVFDILRGSLGVKVLLMEGLSSSAAANERAEVELRKYDSRLAEVPVLTADERKMVVKEHVQLEPYAYEGYQKSKQFERYVGLEGRDLLTTRLFIDFTLGLRSLVEQVNKNGHALVMYDGKFISAGHAQFFLSLAYLQQRFPFDPPPLDANKLSTASAPGLPKPFAAVERGTPGFVESIAWLDRVFPQVVLFDRNEEWARNTVWALSTQQMPAQFAVVAGGDHLTKSEGPQRRSYPELLAQAGVSSLSVFPKSLPRRDATVEQK